AFVTTLSTACSSAANAVLQGANMIRTGQAECVVVGGSECITKFHLNGFNSLMILDQRPCRPFDATRAGLNLGEGAAFLVLENEEHARGRGQQPIAKLAGYGNACDAFHQTASSPDGEGAYRAMCKALQMASLAADKIDYVNAHGTGTANNDSSESAALRRIWGDKVPPVSSTKSSTGHTTSASGTIESVICLLAMQHGFLPANLNYGEPDPQCITPVTTVATGQTLHYVLCNSFGFGGNDTSIIFASPSCDCDLANAEGFKPLYIRSAKQVSIQGALTEQWMGEPAAVEEGYNRSADPDFKQYIPPLEARRMGRLLKRAIVSSQAALDAAGLEQVDAIVTGTGLGCIENTELFLDDLCRKGEELLKPTYFMQSTHNTISSLVAIRRHCHGYNATYAHKESSFDSALLDVCQQMQLGLIDTALVGGHDEMTPSYFNLLRKIDYLGQKGQASGETAASIVVDANGSNGMARIMGVRMLYKPTSIEVNDAVCQMIDAAGVSLNDIDGVLTSLNGAAVHDESVMSLCSEVFKDVPILRYKHLFGESYTASALGLYVAACCIEKGLIPDSLYVEGRRSNSHRPNSLMICNTTDDKCLSLVLVMR
ncbi:MAG: beta-ketoacyl-[Bacteroidales bacterium]|nr:beta-ketoacyl-[acyl-carrier-protein] synthase family protein [Bacteroidales bacterium]